MADSPPAARTADGVHVRWASSADLHRVGDLSAQVFDPGCPPLDSWLTKTVADIAGGGHPQARPEDYAVAVDDTTGDVVGAAVLFTQPWTVGATVLALGRPEIVVTRADHRGRGVMRAVLDLLHHRSTELGHVAQCITGVPFLYRRVGYSYTHPFGHGRVIRVPADVPVTGTESADHHEPDAGSALQDASAADLAAIVDLAGRAGADVDVWTPQDSRYLAFAIDRQNPLSRRGVRTLVYRAPGGAVEAVLQVGRDPGPGFSRVVSAWLASFADPLAVTRAVLRRAVAQCGPGGTPDAPHDLLLALGDRHVLYEAVAALGLTSQNRTTDNWYLRIPDVPRFLGDVTDELTGRLAGSAFRRFSGSLTLDDYKSRTEVVIDNGAVTDVRPSPVAAEPEVLLHVAPDALPALLTGFHSLDQLARWTPETAGGDFAGALGRVLFPPLTATTLPLD